MNRYESKLAIDFMQEVLDKAVIDDNKLSVEELEGYDLTVYDESDMNILKEYFMGVEEYIYVAYLQKKLDEIK